MFPLLNELSGQNCTERSCNVLLGWPRHHSLSLVSAGVGKRFSIHTCQSGVSCATVRGRLISVEVEIYRHHGSIDNFCCQAGQGFSCEFAGAELWRCG